MDDTKGTNLPAEIGTKALDLPEQWNRQGDVVLAFAEHLEARWRIATMLVKSGMIREKKPEAVMAIMLKAYEMGVPLMQAIGGMYFVDGKVALEGHLMDALAIRRCGVTKTVVERTDEVCKLVLHREGWDDLPVEYTLEDAKRVGLVGKSNWKKHPKQMLYWRALSDGLRQIAPDYFTGVYGPDELEMAEMAGGAGTVSANAELDALASKGTDPVEPDPDELTLDEIDQMRQEFASARKMGLIDGDREDAALALAVRGLWTEARDEWEAVRIEMARAEAGAEQGSLV